MTSNEERILQMLSFSAPMQEKQQALREIMVLADIGFLFRPAMYRNSWDFCAKVLFFIDDALLVPYVHNMLLWVEALNDEGSELVELRLWDMSSDILIPELNSFIISKKNTTSLDWYYGIRRFVESYLLQELSPEAKAVLQEISK